MKVWSLACRWATAWLVMLVCGGLVACDPPGKPHCPELSGHYAVHASGPNGEAAVIFESWLAGRPELHGNWEAWRHVTISGESERALQLRLWRVAGDSDDEARLHADVSPRRLQMMDRAAQREWAAENPGQALPEGQLPSGRAKAAAAAVAAKAAAQRQAPPEPPEVEYLDLTLRHGVDYFCGRGELAGEWLAGWREGPAGKRWPEGWKPGTVSIKRSLGGHLDASLSLSKVTEVIVWCGDGCKGIPVWVSSQEITDRWAKTGPPPEGAAMRRWGTPAAQPARAQPPDAGEPGPSRSAAPEVRAADAALPPRFTQVVLTYLPAGALPGTVVASDGGWLVTVFTEGRPAMAEILRRLEAAPEFENVQVRESVAGEGGMWVSRLWLHWVGPAAGA